MDGTPKQTYKHPNFGQNAQQQQGHLRANNIHVVQQFPNLQEMQGNVENFETTNRRLLQMQARQRDNLHQPELIRGVPAVKPAKMNIPEFDGTDVDSWIQTIELYVDAARTPLENRIEVAVTYLKGDAIQWWRGTGYNVTNVPWHRFCRYLGDKFAKTSLCDNVRSFHSLTQPSTVAIFIQNLRLQ